VNKKANTEAKRRLERMPYRLMDINGKPVRDYTEEEKKIVKEIERERENSLKNPTK
jgi:hypothetical protein